MSEEVRVYLSDAQEQWYDVEISPGTSCTHIIQIYLSHHADPTTSLDDCYIAELCMGYERAMDNSETIAEALQKWSNHRDKVQFILRRKDQLSKSKSNETDFETMNAEQLKAVSGKQLQQLAQLQRKLQQQRQLLLNVKQLQKNTTEKSVGTEQLMEARKRLEEKEKRLATLRKLKQEALKQTSHNSSIYLELQSTKDLFCRTEQKLSNMSTELDELSVRVKNKRQTCSRAENSENTNEQKILLDSIEKENRINNEQLAQIKRQKDSLLVHISEQRALDRKIADLTNTLASKRNELSSKQTSKSSSKEADVITLPASSSSATSADILHSQTHSRIPIWSKNDTRYQSFPAEKKYSAVSERDTVSSRRVASFDADESVRFNEDGLKKISQIRASNDCPHQKISSEKESVADTIEPDMSVVSGRSSDNLYHPVVTPSSSKSKSSEALDKCKSKSMHELNIGESKESKSSGSLLSVISRRNAADKQSFLSNNEIAGSKQSATKLDQGSAEEKPDIAQDDTVPKSVLSSNVAASILSKGPSAKIIGAKILTAPKFRETKTTITSPFHVSKVNDRITAQRKERETDSESDGSRQKSILSHDANVKKDEPEAKPSCQISVGHIWTRKAADSTVVQAKSPSTAEQVQQSRDLLDGKDCHAQEPKGNIVENVAESSTTSSVPVKSTAALASSGTEPGLESSGIKNTNVLQIISARESSGVGAKMMAHFAPRPYGSQFGNNIKVSEKPAAKSGEAVGTGKAASKDDPPQRLSSSSTSQTTSGSAISSASTGPYTVKSGIAVDLRQKFGFGANREYREQLRNIYQKEFDSSDVTKTSNLENSPGEKSVERNASLSVAPGDISVTTVATSVSTADDPVISPSRLGYVSNSAHTSSQVTRAAAVSGSSTSVVSSANLSSSTSSMGAVATSGYNATRVAALDLRNITSAEANDSSLNSVEQSTAFLSSRGLSSPQSSPLSSSPSRTDGAGYVGFYRVMSATHDDSADLDAERPRYVSIVPRPVRRKSSLAGGSESNDMEKPTKLNVDVVRTLTGTTSSCEQTSESLDESNASDSAGQHHMMSSFADGRASEEKELEGRSASEIGLRVADGTVSVDSASAGEGGTGGGRRKKAVMKLSRRVSFEPLALLLDAALEGELEVVQRSAASVHDINAANEEGVTALHNAICAGHFAVVKFLVDSGCDVNAADSDGWTPLHCAASCNNHEMLEYLVERGACIFATTISDQELAVDKCEEYEEGYQKCLQYLRAVESDCGILNDGVIYAAFDYTAENDDELTFLTGDKLIVIRKGDDEERDWWWCSLHDREGYVPRNLICLYPRVVPQWLNCADVTSFN